MLDLYNGFLGPTGGEDRSHTHDHGQGCECDGCLEEKDPGTIEDLGPNVYIDVEADGFILSPFGSQPTFGGLNGPAFAGTGSTRVFMDGDVAGDASTTARVEVNGSFTSIVDVDDNAADGRDQDWIAVDLEAGTQYTIFMIRSGDNAHADPLMRIIQTDGTAFTYTNENGVLTDEFDDILAVNGEDVEFISQNSRAVFTPDVSGTYYISAEGFSFTRGQYTVYVNEGDFRPTVDVDTVADFLANGFDRRSVWDQDTIIYDISALSAAEAVLAVAAMELWADVTPLNFVEAVGNDVVDLTFTNDEDGAFASTNIAAGRVITSAQVNISATDWIEEYGTEFNSYSFQTYIHEVGHALGLGHGGPYNGFATYGTDNVFANDLWNYSVMSYNDQGEGIGELNGTPRLVLGLQTADLIAIHDLYGAAESTRGGSNTYGFNSTLTGTMFDFGAFEAAGIRPPSLAIYDTGGDFDRIDLRGYTAPQTISLMPESFSSVGNNTNLGGTTPLINNLSIARDTIIEILFAGQGSDIITGNNVDNIILAQSGDDVINGMDGKDTIFAGSGDDTVYGDAGDDFLLGSTGNDTMYGGEGVDLLNGEGGNDTLYGDAGNDVVAGLGGDDILFGGEGRDSMFGGNGDDVINGEADIDFMYGGNGNDTINGGDGGDQLYAGTGNDILNGEAGADLIFGESGIDTIDAGAGNDNAYGGADDDIVDGGDGNDNVFGDSGNDVLFGGAGTDLVAGGTGNDTLDGGAGNDSVFGGAGNDILSGGTGSNTLVGGADADIFVVNVQSGGVTETSVITDFAQGVDTINVSGSAAFDTFAEIQAVAVQSGNSTVLGLGSAVLILQNTQVGDLTAADFGLTSGQEKVDTIDIAVAEALESSFDFKADIAAPVSVALDDFGALTKMDASVFDGGVAPTSPSVYQWLSFYDLDDSDMGMSPLADMGAM